MSGRIPREFIDDLLVRVDIVDLIDSHVPLKKSGSNFMARCPFHTEKTPSFSVSRKKQFYHCFGCGAGGNAISFLMDYSHLNFVEAIEDLASFIGIDVPREQNTSNSRLPTTDYSAIYDALDKAKEYYLNKLKTHPEGKKAIAYLKNRGLTGETAKQFALGFAPDQWNNLQQLSSQTTLLDAGLLVKNDKNSIYDRFRDRLIFPIRDKRNRVIGFGGRVLDDSLPKYINSPETAVFSKGREVYGLHELLQTNSKPEYILITEGYMDVIALAQFGITNVVATLGTATSKAHLDTLFRFTNQLIFCFDGDQAGRQAAWRAMETALPSLSGRRQIKFMVLPTKQDPDSLIRQEGLEQFSQRIQSATNLTEYFFSLLLENTNLQSIGDKAKFIEQARQYLTSIPSGFARDMMLKDFGDKIGRVELEISKKPATLNKTRQTPARIAIALLLQNPEFAELLEQRNLNPDTLNFPGSALFFNIVATIDELQPNNAAILLESYRGSDNEKTIRTLANLVLSIPDEKAEFCGVLDHLSNRHNESDLDALLEKEKREGLTPDEKENLRKILNRKK
jgi:DNA primase